MNNENIRIEIAAILQSRAFNNSPYKNIEIGYFTALDIADALIAAGIGDVKDAEYRAEKAEQLKNQYCRALLNLARRYVVKTNMTLPHGDEPHSRSTDIEMLALYIIANECEQAEKELAEERKDD